MEKTLLAGRSTKSNLSFEAFVSLVLSKVPAQTSAHWEHWLLNWRGVLVEKWGLSGSPEPESRGSAFTTKSGVRPALKIK
jgi:hypothetical protein